MFLEDVLGYVLEDALPIIKEEYNDVAVVITKPPRGNPNGVSRVVRIDKDNSGKVIVTAACQERGVQNGL